MRDVMRFLGLAGVVLFLFGIIPYSVTGEFDLWTAVHVTGGAALLIASVGLNFARVRRTVAARGTRERLIAVAGVAIFLAIVIAVNVFAARHPWSFDATETGIHTLSDRSRAAIDSLDGPVEFLAFLDAGDPLRPATAKLLDRFAALTPDLTWRFASAVREPVLARRLGVIDEGVVVARMGARSALERLDPGTGLTEGAVMTLLTRVSFDDAVIVYSVTGHGEPAIDDLGDPEGMGALAEVFLRDWVTLQPVLLSAAPAVPEDADLLIVAGPIKPLLDHEVEQIAAYLDAGGRGLFLIDPGTDHGLDRLLEPYGVRFADDMVVDQEEIPVFGPRLGLAPIIGDFPDHPITRGLKDRIVLVLSRSVDVVDDGAANDARVIARTRAAAWAEQDYAAMLESGRVTRDDHDVLGPIPVAVASSRPDDRGGESRIVVVGDSDFARNSHLARLFNQEFLVGAVQWLVGRETPIAEGPRRMRTSRLDLTVADQKNLFRLSVLLFPEALVILGLGLWWRRKSL